MHHAAREATDGFHFLRLQELGFELFERSEIADHRSKQPRAADDAGGDRDRHWEIATILALGDEFVPHAGVGQHFTAGCMLREPRTKHVAQRFGHQTADVLSLELAWLVAKHGATCVACPCNCARTIRGDHRVLQATNQRQHRSHRPRKCRGIEQRNDLGCAASLRAWQAHHPKRSGRAISSLHTELASWICRHRCRAEPSSRIRLMLARKEFHEAFAQEVLGYAAAQCVYERRIAVGDDLVVADATWGEHLVQPVANRNAAEHLGLFPRPTERSEQIAALVPIGPTGDGPSHSIQLRGGKARPPGRRSFRDGTDNTSPTLDLPAQPNIRPD